MTHLRPLFAVIAVALAVLASAPAHASTLDVLGPDGAEVRVDGSSRGVLPLAQPLSVEPGEIELQVRRRGYVTHTEVVAVEDGQAVVLEVDLMPLSRWQAMGSSAVLAGLGQLYQGRSVTGWSMMTVQIGAWGWLLLADDRYKTARDEYLTALSEYEAAQTERLIATKRAEAQTAFDDVESKNDLRTWATVAVVAIGAWSVFDAWRAHDGFFDGPIVDTPLRASVVPEAGGTRMEVGYRWSF